ncbi:MAG: glycoside hydrolase family 15 protein [Proteobacteria bacterium]|nr:glycoside hydrolase family 15 protein [Pseudomonadota bacterium]
MVEPATPTLALGIVGNCVLNALIDRRARFVWCCLPRFDGDPVFCSLLAGQQDDDGGGFLDTEIDRCVASDQRYLVNTAILTTTLTDADGQSVRIVDFAPRFKRYERVFRPRMLIRRIEAPSGACRVRIRIRPRVEFGRALPRVQSGSHHIRYLADNVAIRVTTDVPITYIAEEQWFILNAPATLIIGTDEDVASEVSSIATSFLERTTDYWLEWVRYLSVPFEWQDAVIRAAITLKLCSFEETGAIIAAATASIPEAPGSSRNWDYRFCWLRDAYFVVQALNRLGATRTMEDFIRYITDVAAHAPDARLQPVYPIVPGTSMDERLAPSLAGYRGMGPVRIGNLAATQVQNDSYGSVVLAATQMFFDRRLPRPGDLGLYRRLETLGEWAVKTAFEPDAGLWEYRGRTRIHTHSSVMCWAACDRLGKIARMLGEGQRAEHWRGIAESLRREILKRAWNPRLGSFVESLDGEHVDASLLLLQEFGFVSPSDPRFLGTLDLVERQLRRGPYMLRYAAPDDLGVPTTAFTICTFWYIDALVAVGRSEDARAILEHTLSCRNHLGLLSEDIDPATGELWGNFPQTYSMVGLIISAMRLSKSWEEAFWRGS